MTTQAQDHTQQSFEHLTADEMMATFQFHLSQARLIAAHLGEEAHQRRFDEIEQIDAKHKAEMAEQVKRTTPARQRRLEIFTDTWWTLPPNHPARGRTAALAAGIALSAAPAWASRAINTPTFQMAWIAESARNEVHSREAHVLNQREQGLEQREREIERKQQKLIQRKTRQGCHQNPAAKNGRAKGVGARPPGQEGPSTNSRKPRELHQPAPAPKATRSSAVISE